MSSTNQPTAKNRSEMAENGPNSVLTSSSIELLNTTVRMMKSLPIKFKEDAQAMDKIAEALQLLKLEKKSICSNKDEQQQQQLIQKKAPIQFNDLPAKFLNKMFNKLEIRELICLRIVCITWKSMIESLCHERKSLMLFSYLGDKKTELKDRFFDAINLNEYVQLELKEFHRYPEVTTYLSRDFCVLLFNRLFPNVDQLIIAARLCPSSANNLNIMLEKYWPNVSTLSLQNFFTEEAKQFHYVCARVNQLKSLKRLDIFGCFVELPSAPLFAQLEHFSCVQDDTDEILSLMPPLGTSCTSFWFQSFQLKVSTFDQWMKRNSIEVLRNITHLGLSWIADSEVLRLICANFESLQVLSIKYEILEHMPLFSASTCVQLSKLRHLKIFRISSTQLNLKSLKDKKTLPLLSIRVFHLMNFGLYPKFDPNSTNQFIASFNGEEFCRTLATIMPNIEELGIFSGKELI